MSRQQQWLLVGLLLIANFVGVAVFSQAEPIAVIVTKSPEVKGAAEVAVMTTDELNQAVSEGKPILVKLYKVLAPGEQPQEKLMFYERYQEVVYQGELELIEGSDEVHDSSRNLVRYFYYGWSLRNRSRL